MKRLLTILALVLALGLCCALAESTPTVYTSGEWAYILLEDGTAEIKEYRGESADVTVPTELDGYRVTAIGNSAFHRYNSYPVTITIPDSVTGMGLNPFRSCHKLQEIVVSPEHPTLAVIDGVLFEKTEKRLVFYPRTMKAESYAIPQGIRIIGAYAFDSCSMLKAVTLPDSVVSIEQFAFNGCSALETIVIPEGVTVIPNKAFGDCKALRSVTLPSTVVSIDYAAFYCCENLAKIGLPEGLTSIGEAAFMHAGLRSITFPETLQEIGDDAFQSCEYLRSIVLPDSLTSLGSNPFRRCIALREIRVSPEHPVLAVIDGVLYEKTEKRLVCCPSALQETSVVIPKGIRVIGEAAFDGCTKLAEVIIPDTVTEIGTFAFFSCESLRQVAIPEGVTILEPNLFYQCSALEKVTLPQTLTEIGSFAFDSCTSLREVVIPEGVTSIGTYAFQDCDALKKLTIPASVTAIGGNAFWYCDSLILTVTRDSFAHQYCRDNEYEYELSDALDWLNE